VGDYVSKKLFQDLLMDEEGHTDFLETQLGLLDRIGHERYELLNAEPANAADSGDAGSDH
jgi:bacterioferritin